MFRFSTLFLLFLVSVLCVAQIPNGYYTNAFGKNKAELKTALYNIIKGHTDKGYDGLYTIYAASDKLPTGKVWDMYSIKADGTANYYYNFSQTCGGTYNSEADCYNREHTFCDSWLGKASPQRSDAHHIVPTDGYVNNRRNNYPHGKVGSVSWTSSNGGKLGTSDSSTGYSGIVFEPIDEFKGDFARMYFYVATRYEDKFASWVNNGTANVLLAGNTYPGYKLWFYNLMVQWNRQDPVSQKEIVRNNIIHEFQHNRNPFIDYPQLAEYIWGTKMNDAFSTTTSIEESFYTPNIYYSNNSVFVEDFESNGFLSIYDLQGKVISRTEIFSGNNRVEVKLKDTVIAVINSNKGVYSKKIFIQD